jgi:hypothetical protein
MSSLVRTLNIARCNGRCTGGRKTECEHDLNPGFTPCKGWSSWYAQQSTNMKLAPEHREVYRRRALGLPDEETAEEWQERQEQKQSDAVKQ